MNIGVIRENGPVDRRVALTPPVVRHLVEAGHAVWIESGAGDGAMFYDPEYLRAGAQVAWKPAEVVQRADLVVRISAPPPAVVDMCRPGTVLLAFYHLAAAQSGILARLLERSVTAIGCEIIQTESGRLPVLAAISEIAGPMTIQIAAHLLRSSAGGRGILLGGSPGVPPAHVVVLGAGEVGRSAARAAVAGGARVTVLDRDPDKLRRLLEHLPNVATGLAEYDLLAHKVTTADVLIGAVLVAGSKTPHVVPRELVERMQPGSAIIDVSIDQGGCVETSRPTTIAEPTFVYHGVTHYCVPNLTADMGRSTSVAFAQAVLPYLQAIGRDGTAEALRRCPELARGVYTHDGAGSTPVLAEVRSV